MLNSFINPNVTDKAPEGNLLQDLYDEAIQVSGVNMRYAKREMLNRDYLFGESPISRFMESIEIEMEIVEIEDFAGDTDLYLEMGIVREASAKFRVSTRRFPQEAACIDLTRPREGDLVYLPLDDSMWEISNVRPDENMRRFGCNPSWRLVCKMWQYSHEKLTDTDPDISKFGDITYKSEPDDGILETLRLLPSDFNDESADFMEDAEEYKGFDPTNPFGGC